MAVPTAVIFYKNNTQYIQIDGLQDGLSNPAAYFNAATVTATLLDSTGVASIPEVNNLALAYVASSNGSYRGVVPATFNPSGSSYSLVITAVQGGVQLEITIRARVQTRTK